MRKSNFFLDIFIIIMYYKCINNYEVKTMSNNFVENYKKMSDEDIVSLINGGELELLQIIIERYLPKILYCVNKYSGTLEREDAIQEATYALYSAVKNYKSGKSSFSTFAMLCIKRSLFLSFKKTNRQKDVPDDLVTSLDAVEIADCNSPEKIFFDRESLKSLTDSIKLELSGLEYSVLALFLEGKRYSQIADELGISEKSVNNALIRIRKKLKKQ